MGGSVVDVVVVGVVVVVVVVGTEVGVVAGADEVHPTTTNDAATRRTERMPPPYGTKPPLQESRQTCFSRPPHRSFRRTCLRTH